MSRTASTLRYRVPAPFAFEAPSSWLSRLALSQGCTLEELVRFLGLRHGLFDLDRAMHGAALAELRRGCSLPEEAFAIAGRVMVGFRRAAHLGRSLLFDSKGSPCFRYCPLCLRQRRLPHLDIHWRFADWRYCPEHNCLMEDACWACRAPIGYPSDMELSNAGRAGRASQGRCQVCAEDLSAAVPCMINPASSTAIKIGRASCRERVLRLV